MNFYQQVYKIVQKIPKGKVATYDQIAGFISTPRAARIVGWALRVGGSKVPWQRVINSAGMISIASIAHPPEQQASLLRQEGVKVKKIKGNYYVNLKTDLWKP